MRHGQAEVTLCETPPVSVGFGEGCEIHEGYARAELRKAFTIGQVRQCLERDDNVPRCGARTYRVRISMCLNVRSTALQRVVEYCYG